MNGSGGKRIAILVAGMHRSGTSALARVLNIAGCDLPRTLMKPQRDNTAGFWESQAIMDLNEEILASAGSSWDDWRPFDRGWYASPLAEGFRERALELLQNEFGGSRLFVLKDPRICRLLEFWSEATGAFGARPLVVSPLRSPFDVASSLHARNGIDPFVGHLIWLRHVLDAEAASRSLKRSYLRYEQLLSQAQALIDRLGEDLDVSWPKRQSPFAEMEVDEFLSPALRHHHSEDADHRSNPRLSHWITASFDIFDRWSRGDARKEDMPDLDRIRAAFDEAAPAFSRALAAGRTADQKNRLLTSELEASRSEVDALIRELESARHLAKERKDRIDVLWKEREGARLSAKERKDRIDALWKEREGARLSAKERKDRIDVLWKEREGFRLSAKERKDRIDVLWKERESARYLAKERKDRIDVLWKERESARYLAKERKDRIDVLWKERESARYLAKERKDRIDALWKEREGFRLSAKERKDRIDVLWKERESARYLAKERKDRIDALWKEREGFRLSAKERKDRIDVLWKERESARYLAKERKDRIDALWKEREGFRLSAKERKDRIDVLWKERESARYLAKERKDRIDALWKEREGARLSAKERKDRIGALTRELETARMGHVMAFAQRGARFGIEELEVGVLLNPEWVEQAGQRRDREPALELRRNGRIVARAFTRDLSHNVVRFAAGLRLPVVGCALYSLHDARSGEVLAALAAVAWRQARRVVGTVESRPRPEVRGWALDPGNPGRSRRVAIHVDGHLRKVVTAAERRADIARWQGTEGRHGFLWRIPEGGAVKDGMRIEVFDADTGRRLRGSPLRIEGGRAINSTRRGA